jgi:hypothetical protein
MTGAPLAGRVHSHPSVMPLRSPSLPLPLSCKHQISQHKEVP